MKFLRGVRSCPANNFACDLVSIATVVWPWSWSGSVEVVAQLFVECSIEKESTSNYAESRAKVFDRGQLK